MFEDFVVKSGGAAGSPDLHGAAERRAEAPPFPPEHLGPPRFEGRLTRMLRGGATIGCERRANGG